MPARRGAGVLAAIGNRHNTGERSTLCNRADRRGASTQGPPGKRIGRTGEVRATQRRCAQRMASSRAGSVIGSAPSAVTTDVRPRHKAVSVSESIRIIWAKNTMPGSITHGLPS
jgi:hypothetical protein